jgi:hypothetical protein
MKKIRNIGLMVIIGLMITSCGSSPEEQIKEVIKNGYEVTNGKFDNSKEEDKLSRLKDELGDEISRGDITRIWNEVRIEYWTSEMAECYEKEMENINVEDIRNEMGGCIEISNRVINDYGKFHKEEAAEALIEINKGAYEIWKSKN